MLLDRLRIRGRLLALVAVPLALVIALAFAVAFDRTTRAARASNTAATARQAGDVGRMLQELQEERLLALGYLADRIETTDLTGQGAAVQDLARVARDGVPAGREALASAIDGVMRLDGIRSRVIERSATQREAFNDYTRAITGVIVSLRLTSEIDTASPAGRQMAALNAFIDANEANSESAALLVILASEVDDLTIQRYAASRAVADEAAKRFREYATPAEAAYIDRIGRAYDARVGGGFATAFAANPREAVARLSLDSLFARLESFDVLGRFAERTIVTEVTLEVEAEARRQLLTAVLVAVLALLLPLIVVGFGLGVGAGIARPLRRLTRSANRVARAAETELARVADDESEASEPLRLEAVDVLARDEIGELARAFERIQVTAAGLVERQVLSRRNVAQMFGHIGRRTQNMVGRQLDLIDHLEYQETDAARLRELYRLDHLASRLRRSASSLVVLSGLTDTSRYRAPIPLGELIRLALGEIEDYTRVDIDVPREMVITPAVIGDLILMVAELMENATRFSPPQTQVTVTGQVTGDAAHVSVIDHGLGLTDQRLAEENARLARRERLDLVPTEVLGLFVVGRLARRHGATVELSHTPGGGITASLAFPRSILVSDVAAMVPVTVGAARPMPAPVASVRSGAPSVAMASRAPAPTRIPVVDVGALERLNALLDSGVTWNAFDPSPVASPPRPPAMPPTLRQRVPGAQLPTATSASVAMGAPPISEASAVRDLVEAFEGGVRRAQDKVGRPPLDAPIPPVGGPPMPPPAPPMPPPTPPAVPTPPMPPPAPPAVPAPPGAAAPLTRRVPGATVDPLDRRPPPAGAPQLDPYQALSMIKQIEHGVARALDEIHTDREEDRGAVDDV
jgi:signal transduction histidine kinase